MRLDCGSIYYRVKSISLSAGNGCDNFTHDTVYLLNIKCGAGAVRVADKAVRVGAKPVEPLRCAVPLFITHSSSILQQFKSYRYCRLKYKQRFNS
jgi:hypothetical protein